MKFVWNDRCFVEDVIGFCKESSVGEKSDVAFLISFSVAELGIENFVTEFDLSINVKAGACTPDILGAAVLIPFNCAS